MPLPLTEKITARPAASHDVQFFSNDALMVERLFTHLTRGLTDGDGGLAVVASPRREALLERLLRDPQAGAALADGRLTVLDAHETLAGFMRDGMPDQAGFAREIVARLDTLLMRFGRLRAYGEMVDVLWSQGQREATLRLEELWERNIAGRPVDLLCGYRLASFAGTGEEDGFRAVSQAHHHVHPVEDAGADQREIAARQQRALAFAEERRQRLAAQHELQRSEEFTRRVLDSSQDCIKVLDLGGRLLSMNAGGMRAFEVADFAAVANADYAGYWRGADQVAAKAALAAALAGGVGRFQGHCPTLGGKQKWWDVVVTPIAGVDGRPERLLVVSRDISEQRASIAALKRSQAEAGRHAAELERSNAELEQFAYVAAHDLQEPIRMIVSYLQLIERRVGERLIGDARDHFDFVGANAQRMQRMVQSLLDYSRIGKVGEETRVDMAATLRNALTNLEVRIREEQAVIEVGTLPPVRGRPEELTRLWQNLVANAITFRSAEPPRIRIAAVASARGWTFSVADNGIGIATEEAGRLFGLFQRLHPADRYPGTGIGLASCRKIVDHHGGRIWFESTPGRGTTFLFTLDRWLNRRAS